VKEIAAMLAAQMVSEAERLVALCRNGSEEHFEASNALMALERVQRTLGGYGGAERGQLAPPAYRPPLRLVAPVDDPAFDV